MSEQRRITVERADRGWEADEREVEVTLHSGVHSSVLRFTKEEARDLMLQISKHLYWLEKGDEDDS